MRRGDLGSAASLPFDRPGDLSERATTWRAVSGAGDGGRGRAILGGEPYCPVGAPQHTLQGVISNLHFHNSHRKNY